MSDEKTVYTWDGKELTARWDKRLCIHIQECTRAKGALFESGRESWAEPDRGDADYVAEVAERCPTGALTVERKDGKTEQAPAQNTVMVVSNGPLYVAGELQIDGAAPDMPGVAYRAALCRCGHSSQKPFCDNTHEKVNFRDRGAVGEAGEPLAAEGGSLAVNRAPNGPLLLSGNLTVLSGAGRAAWTGTKAALCRCGASKNKPFCDGAHSAAGFEAE